MNIRNFCFRREKIKGLGRRTLAALLTLSLSFSTMALPAAAAVQEQEPASWSDLIADQLATLNEDVPIDPKEESSHTAPNKAPVIQEKDEGFLAPGEENGLTPVPDASLPSVEPELDPGLSTPTEGTEPELDPGFSVPPEKVDPELAPGFSVPSEEVDPELAPGLSVLPEEQRPELLAAGRNSIAQCTPGTVVSISQADLSAFFWTPVDAQTDVPGTQIEVYHDIGLINPVDYYYTFQDGELPTLFNPVYTDAEGKFGPKGMKYIVIATKEQLRKIGTGTTVQGSSVTYTFHWDGTQKKYYLTELRWTEGDAGGLVTAPVRQDQPTGTKDKTNITFEASYPKLKYDANANYLIVNDLDLSETAADGSKTPGLWTPWDYNGKAVVGRVAQQGVTGYRNPVISNFKVVEDVDAATETIDNIHGSSTKGVGFFGAVYSPSNGADVEKNDQWKPPGIITGILAGVLGLLGGLLKLLGGLVTDLIGLISGWENVTKLTVGTVLIDGLTLQAVTLDTDGVYVVDEGSKLNPAKRARPMPVGAFAGQISGSVTVTNCHVKEVHDVKGVQWVGGFVGKTVGATEYLLHGTTSGLAATLHALGQTLDAILNILPVDDLVTNLIDKLGVDKLIPTKYLPAKINDCSVSFAENSAVTASENNPTAYTWSNKIHKSPGSYVGGFAGRVEGSTVTESSAVGLTEVTAKNNVGGFAGRICNTQLVGLLQGLGINLVNFPIGSNVTNCTVEGAADGVRINSTATEYDKSQQTALAYAGGFAGAVMASKVLFNGETGKGSGVRNLRSVTAKGNYVGGFAGYAGVGDLAETLNLLGNLLDVPVKPGLGGEIPLGTGVTKLLNKVLGVNLNAGLLSLIGLSPSQIVGGHVVGVPGGFQVESTEGGGWVGGFVGFLHGGRITEQLVEQHYERVQATDEQGSKLFVGKDAVTSDRFDIRGDLIGAVYARTQTVTNADGTESTTIVYEDVHGSPIKNLGDITKVPGDSPTGKPEGKTCYHIYDNVFINLSDKQKKPATMSSFRYYEDQKNGQGEIVHHAWAPVMGGADNTEPISNVTDLPGYDKQNPPIFPVYQQTVVNLETAEPDAQAEGGVKLTNEQYVKYTHHYSEPELVQKVNKNGVPVVDKNGDPVMVEKPAARQETILRGVNGQLYRISFWSGSDVEQFPALKDKYKRTPIDLNANELEVEALQVSVDDSMVESGLGKKVPNYVYNLDRVYGADFVGGVVGQAKLCSAVDLLSNLTAVQYERFKLDHVEVDGISSGYTVTADPQYAKKSETGTVRTNRAGGAVGYAMGGEIRNVKLNNLGSVLSGTLAGGFAGQLVPGSVAGQDGQGLKLLGLVSVGNLLTVVDAVHTFVSDSSVTGTKGGFTVESEDPNKGAGLTADRSSAAGGFAGESVNSHFTNCDVSRLKSVVGDTYAGGFAGRAAAGSIAGVLNETFKGVDVSKLLGLSKLLSLLEAFPNKFNCCTVNVGEGQTAYQVSAVTHTRQNTYLAGELDRRTNAQEASDLTAGSAGGFLGYGVAVQADYCANENLKSVDATRYAGGFGGFVDIGSVANVGNAGILGKVLQVTGLASLLDCAVSTLKSCHTQGTAGGYTISAFDRKASIDTLWEDLGHAGGFVGSFAGSHIEGCYANHIDKVQGMQTAGGFIGHMVPGDVAKAGEGLSILGGLIADVGKGGLLGALQVMVPSVKNSFAKCVPCGGVVTAYGRKQIADDHNGAQIIPQGMAGGFVGLNKGGQIWGDYHSSTIPVWDKKQDAWVDQEINPARTIPNRAELVGDYTGNAAGHEKQVYGTGQTCDILQLMKVDATRFAGGYSGHTVAADLASLGDIKLLAGAVDLSKLLSLGQFIIPTQKNTGVTGPLRNTTQSQMDYFHQQAQNKGLADKVDFTKYYGYTVGSEEWETQASGGYCGMMTTGVVEHSVAYDLISSTAEQMAGGFVGGMLTGGLATADLEGSLLGGILGKVTELGENLLGAVNVSVPVIKTSGVYGYYSGSHVTASNGTAGGFAGTVRGGQIWGEDGAWNNNNSAAAPNPIEPAPADGAADPMALPAAEPAEPGTPQEPSGSDPARIDTYRSVPSRCFTKNLRGVSASGPQADAGGFVGYMGAASLANLGGLGLLGKLATLPSHFLSGLSVTVPTVYYADVDAVDSWGFRVSAGKGRSAGGFAGYLQGAQVGVKKKPAAKPAADPSVPETKPELEDELNVRGNINVKGLRSVTAGDYAGGFFGAANAADTLNVASQDEGGQNNKFTLLNLLTLGTISAVELARTYVYNATVSGIDEGYRVTSINVYDPNSAEWNQNKDKVACAGGFGGLENSGGVRWCEGRNLASVQSRNYAGGFVARMGKSALIKVDELGTNGKDLGLLSSLLKLSAGIGDVFGSHVADSTVRGVPGTGYTVAAENGFQNIAGGFVGYADVCRVRDSQAKEVREVRSAEIAGGFMGAMSDATLLSLDLGLLKKLLNGVEVQLDLIKGNRSKVEACKVVGVDDWDGFDVFGGGASRFTDATNFATGYAGAFIGLNTASTVKEGQVLYADQIKGGPTSPTPYAGVEESNALLGGLDLDLIFDVPEVRDGWSKSIIDGLNYKPTKGQKDVSSYYQTVYSVKAEDDSPSKVKDGVKIESTPPGPSVTVTSVSHKLTYWARTVLGNQPDFTPSHNTIASTGHQIAGNHYDLMIHNTGSSLHNRLIITKELRYEHGAIPNVADLEQEYRVEITGPAETVELVIHPGESITLEDVAAGEYTLTEKATALSPSRVELAQPQTITVTSGTLEAPAVHQVTLVNTVKAPPSKGDGTANAATGDRYVINHIPVDEAEPEPIIHPCEILNDDPGQPMLLGFYVERGDFTETQPDAVPVSETGGQAAPTQGGRRDPEDDGTEPGL